MTEKKMIIDGIECPFTDERNVLEVARHNGIDIPSLCYCENLSIYGGCRLCLVENEKGALDAACSMQPRNGLVVYTHSEKVLKSRHTTLQLLMNSHRAECLTCEQSGRCKLQEYAHRYNVVEPRFKDNTFSHERLDVSSPCITRDPSKCILCGLCVRMCSEVQNIGAIDFTKRGKKAIVAPGFGKMLIETGCVGCGQCAAVCPTGALTINRQIPEMWRMLNDPNKRVVVQYAPSVRVGLAEEFGMPANEPVTGKLVTALRRLGVDVVYDTNLSADLTIMEESAEFLEKVKTGAKLPMFTSCCPGWIQHVEKAHPHLMPQVSTCGSPMEMLGALIRKQFKDEDVYSVAIMPCTAKKFEAQRPELEKDGPTHQGRRHRPEEPARLRAGQPPRRLHRRGRHLRRHGRRDRGRHPPRAGRRLSRHPQNHRRVRRARAGGHQGLHRHGGRAVHPHRGRKRSGQCGQAHREG